jgi:hypothetical protein
MDLPAGKRKIWRYTSLAKFVRLIQQQSLYFASASQLEDKFEGSLTTPSVERFINMLTNDHPTLPLQLAYQALSLSMRQIAVNCWHLSGNESYGNSAQVCDPRLICLNWKHEANGADSADTGIPDEFREAWPQEQAGAVS